MRRVLMFAVLFLACATFVAAQEEVPLQPKPPTANQGKMIVIDAVRTARSLVAVEEKITEIDEQMTATRSRIAAHNAVYGGGDCVYTEQNPNACAGWIAEAAELNTAVADLTRQREKQKFRRAELRGNLNMRLARLRIMVLLDGLTDWEQEVVSCSRLKNDADRQCLITAWEHHP